MTDVYVFGAMLLYKSGREINEKNLNDVLEAAGVEVQACRIQSIVVAFHNVDIEQAIKQGTIAAPISVVETPMATNPVPAPESSRQDEDLDIFKRLFG